MVKKKHPKNWIREIRKEQGLTLKELAAKIGSISDVHLGYLERSERDLSVAMARRIASGLEVHYTDIIDGPAGTESITIKDNGEKELLGIYRHLSDNQKQQDFIEGIKKIYGIDNKEEKK